LKRATEKVKMEYLESLCDEIKEFKRTGCYDLMCMKTKELGWKDNQGIQTTGIEDCQGNIIVDQKHILIVGRIMLQSLILQLIIQKTWKPKLKRRWMQTRKALIFYAVKWEKISRR
jgi:hypothetical protein